MSRRRVHFIRIDEDSKVVAKGVTDETAFDVMKAVEGDSLVEVDENEYDIDDLYEAP